ncbi:hypothetical protein EDB84DRAFT_1596289 [Lactarius hengduanensis]|nr:hypothetical protein EDB84DRAFT_1596289 [Lactarius hengduanensis]
MLPRCGIEYWFGTHRRPFARAPLLFFGLCCEDVVDAVEKEMVSPSGWPDRALWGPLSSWATPPLLPLAAPHVSFRGSVEPAFGALRPLRVYANAAHLVMRMVNHPYAALCVPRHGVRKGLKHSTVDPAIGDTSCLSRRGRVQAPLRKLLHTATGGHFAVSARSVHTPTTGGDEIPCCGCALRAPNDDGCGSDSDGPVTRAVLYGANPDCDFPGCVAHRRWVTKAQGFSDCSLLLSLLHIFFNRHLTSHVNPDAMDLDLDMVHGDDFCESRLCFYEGRVRAAPVETQVWKEARRGTGGRDEFEVLARRDAVAEWRLAVASSEGRASAARLGAQKDTVEGHRRARRAREIMRDGAKLHTAAEGRRRVRRNWGLRGAGRGKDGKRARVFRLTAAQEIARSGCELVTRGVRKARYPHNGDSNGGEVLSGPYPNTPPQVLVVHNTIRLAEGT